jgi:small neutral amino acid transporter SnatA (MarC family)
VFLVMPIPRGVMGGGTILVPCALLQQYVTAFHEYRSHDWDVIPSASNRFMAFLAIHLALAGVLVGTLAGSRLLRRIPETLFRRIVGLLVLAVGIYMLVHPA